MATDPHSEYVTFIAFPLQQLLQERNTMLCLYAHCCMSCYIREGVFTARYALHL